LEREIELDDIRVAREGHAEGGLPDDVPVLGR
jgi:hypothetical protein